MDAITPERRRVVLVAIDLPYIVPIAPYVLRAYVEQFDIARTYEILTRKFDLDDAASSIAERINALEPDIVGFSANLANYRLIFDVVKDVRGTVILGGPQVNGLERRILDENPRVAIVVSGEGEIALTEILEHLAGRRDLGRVEGVVTRETSTIPRRTLADMNVAPSVYGRFFEDFPDAPYVVIEHSRGCNQRCKFCAWNGPARTLRFRDTEAVKRDISTACAQKGVQGLYIADSSLLVDKGRAKAILNHLVDLQSDKQCWVEISYWHLDDELLRLMAKAKNVSYCLGIQSVSPEVNRLMSRGFDAERFRTLYRRMLGAVDARQIIPNLIYALPGDTLGRFKESLEYVLSLGGFQWVLVALHTVLPGSAFFYEVEQHGIRYQPGNEFWTAETNTFSRADVRLATRWALYFKVGICNYALRRALMASAEARKAGYFDTMVEFFDGLDGGLMPPPEWPDDRLTFDEQVNRHANGLLQNGQFKEIVDRFRAHTGHRFDELLADHESQFALNLVY